MKKNGPWQVKQSQVKYENHWISVREDQVVQPDGKPGIFGVVTSIGGVSTLPLDKDGNVYLTQEFRYGIARDSIEAASGGVDPGEQPIDGAKRELLEELGITATDWTDLGMIDPLTSAVVSPQHLFLAKELSFTSAHPEATEIITKVKVPFGEAVKMVQAGKITHAPTCVLILKAWLIHLEQS